MKEETLNKLNSCPWIIPYLSNFSISNDFIISHNNRKIDLKINRMRSKSYHIFNNHKECNYLPARIGIKIALSRPKYCSLKNATLYLSCNARCSSGALFENEEVFELIDRVNYLLQHPELMSFEIKTLPSGIVVENRPDSYLKYCWCIKGTWIFHNEDEPALEYKEGSKQWYQHNKCHRLDGPAIEYADGRKSYCINDIAYEEENYWKHPDVLADQYLKEHPELQGFI